MLLEVWSFRSLGKESTILVPSMAGADPVVEYSLVELVQVVLETHPHANRSEFVVLWQRRLSFHPFAVLDVELHLVRRSFLPSHLEIANHLHHGKFHNHILLAAPQGQGLLLPAISRSILVDSHRASHRQLLHRFLHHHYVIPSLRSNQTRQAQVGSRHLVPLRPLALSSTGRSDALET